LVKSLADALAYAHDKGVVHRDVKPANIMLDASGAPFLMDFGLASRRDEASKLTNDGAVLGTPSYMAPEQAAGRSGEAGPAADQYSLGCVLFELLTGDTPFSGPPEVQVFHHVRTEPTSPRKLNPKVPVDLAAICLKCLEKDPARRYPTCGEFAADLERFVAGRPVLAAPAGPLVRAAKWVRREPVVAGLGGALFVVLTAWLFSILSGVVFKVRTPEGTLVVEVNEPDPEIFVDGRKVTVTWRENGKKAEITVRPGTHQVEVKKDGFTAYGEAVKLKDGETEVLKASLPKLTGVDATPSPLSTDLKTLTPDQGQPSREKAVDPNHHNEAPRLPTPTEAKTPPPGRPLAEDFAKKPFPGSSLDESEAGPPGKAISPQVPAETRRKIVALEAQLRANLGKFDWAIHNDLRHLYFDVDEKKSVGHCNIILQNSVMDGYTLDCIGARLERAEAIKLLLIWPDKYPEYTYVAAACWIKAAELLGKDDARSKNLLERVASLKGKSIKEYQSLAARRLRDLTNP
jgi:hypothetical protein